MVVLRKNLVLGIVPAGLLVIILNLWYAEYLPGLVFPYPEEKQKNITGRQSTRKLTTSEIQDICNRNSGITQGSFGLGGRLLINNKLYYCNVAKCGSSFMNLFFRKLFKCENCFTEVQAIVRHDGYNVTRKLIEQADYSFMIVREPYGRLLAAYENKLYRPSEGWKNLGIEVIENVRHNATTLSKLYGHDVAFKELVEYAVASYEEGRSMNVHIAPIHVQCDPCNINFDLIGKLEDITDDLVYLVNHLRTKDIYTGDIISTGQITELEADAKYKRYFGPVFRMFEVLQLYKDNISTCKLFQRIWSSYHIRGIIHTDYKMPFIEDCQHITEKMFYEQFKFALDASEGRSIGVELKAQRREALVQAYSTVPIDAMLRLREFVKTDCLLFGYDDKPDYLFNRENEGSISAHNYFVGL